MNSYFSFSFLVNMQGVILKSNIAKHRFRLNFKLFVGLKETKTKLHHCNTISQRVPARPFVHTSLSLTIV